MTDRILILTPSLSGGGAEKVAINLANEWARQGLDIHLTSIRDIADYSNLLLRDVEYRSLGASRARYSIPALNRHIRRIRPTRILSVIRDSNIILGLSQPDVNQISIVYREANTLHGFDNKTKLYENFYLASMRYFYWRVNAVVANSRDTLSDLQGRGVDNPNATVIPNPVLPANYYSLMQEDADHPWLVDASLEVILSAGRLHEAKDYPTLLRAFARVAQERPSARLLILGQGPEEQALKELRSKLQLDDVISFHGFASNPWPFYRQAQVFALSSQWEGFGNVIVEALAAGTTVVTTDCPGGPRTITRDGDFGYLTRCGDPVHLAENLRLALECRFDPCILKKRAWEYSVETISKRYLAAFG